MYLLKLKVCFRKGYSSWDQDEKNRGKGGLTVHLASCPFLLSHLPALSLDVLGDVSRVRPMETEMPSLPPNGVARSGAIRLASWSWGLVPKVTTGHELW